MDSDIEEVEDPKTISKSSKNAAKPQLPAKRARDFDYEIGSGPPEEVISLMLANTLKNQDPTGWWLSEKLDGVRCYWNGKSFVSRQGNPYDVPDFFVEGLPKTVSLDGELWVGRKAFQECVSIVRCTNNGKNDMSRWNKVKFMLFDAPSIDAPFEERLEYLKKFGAATTNQYVEVLPQRICTGKKDLSQEAAKIEALGGEGVMLRQPKSMYEGRRTSTLLKVKSFKDAEATVIAHEQGKGKFKGMFGALKVRMDNGKEFKIGSGFSDAERQDPPPIGSVVTYKYQELSNDGIPRFPTYLRRHPGL
ncbi:unnamed protein product [Blepharisma stoltei]|uniref:DNA ligase n=1 Tax=Blepharisma stoltei TaxID=1481888 RepID=A0AAU9IIE6_9CILI|nr:unnamed protein product [Blepharisma stoltei]